MLEAGWRGGVVSSCLRDVVDPSRSIIGGGDPAGAGSSGGGVEEERFGNPGMAQDVEERRMTVPTRERNVFLGIRCSSREDRTAARFDEDSVPGETLVLEAN